MVVLEEESFNLNLTVLERGPGKRLVCKWQWGRKRGGLPVGMAWVMGIPSCRLAAHHSSGWFYVALRHSWGWLCWVEVLLSRLQGCARRAVGRRKSAAVAVRTTACGWLRCTPLRLGGCAGPQRFESLSTQRAVAGSPGTRCFSRETEERCCCCAHRCVWVVALHTAALKWLCGAAAFRASTQ
jgi:hypothetical protein